MGDLFYGIIGREVFNMNNEMIRFFREGSVAIPRLLLTNYKTLGLNETEFMLLLHIHSFVEQGISFPTPDEIAARMTISPEVCMQQLRKLVQKGFITIEERIENHIRSERYSLDPLWEKLIRTVFQGQKQDEQHEEQLYTVFEHEFGRPLSPMECETLAMWMDQDEHDPTIIKAALREAVLSGKLNFRYIDRILFEWKKNGIKTIEQAQQHAKKFRKNQGKQDEPYKPTVPIYNWLEQS
jgi:DNA replication protein